jgi:hypothetical protein
MLSSCSDLHGALTARAVRKIFLQGVWPAQLCSAERVVTARFCDMNVRFMTLLRSKDLYTQGTPRRVPRPPAAHEQKRIEELAPKRDLGRHTSRAKRIHGACVRDLRGSAEWQGRSAKLAFIILGTMRGYMSRGIANVRGAATHQHTFRGIDAERLVRATPKRRVADRIGQAGIHGLRLFVRYTGREMNEICRSAAEPARSVIPTLRGLTRSDHNTTSRHLRATATRHGCGDL